jgi:hypothetical protein
MDTAQGKPLDWNDTIENDGSDYTLLPAGVYPFAVIKFERARFAGSAKQPPCNQAKLTLDVGNEEVSTTIEHNLFLHQKNEWALCQFFRSIGGRKHGERMVMDWTKVPGATGRAKVGVRDWTGKDGKVHQSNQVEKFLDPADDDKAKPADGAAQGEMAF